MNGLRGIDKLRGLPACETADRGVVRTRIACRRPRLLARPRRHGARSTRPPPAGGRPQTEMAQAALERSGSALLDRLAGDVGSLEGGPRHRETGDIHDKGLSRKKHLWVANS
jgi:hypothetical protein